MNQKEQFAAHVSRQLSQWLGAIPLLMPLLQQLNLVEIINRYCPNRADVSSGMVALILVLNRLLAPKPMYQVGTWMAETVLPDLLGIEALKLHDRRIGDLLDDIFQHLDDIWRELIDSVIDTFEIPIELVHYDITSIYFEGVYTESEKITYGYSRDNRPDCKQVNLALNVTSDDAIPLAYRVISGRTADVTTPLENMRALQQLLKERATASADNPGLIIASDQAMLDAAVIVAYHQQGIGYLGPLPHHKVYDPVLMSATTEELLRHPLDYRPKNQPPDSSPIYYGVLGEVTIVSKQTKQQVTTNALLLHSRNKAKLDRDKRQTLLNRYLARLREISAHLNRRKYKKASYAQAQLQKAKRQYQAVESLVTVKLTGSDSQLHLQYDVDIKTVLQAAERDGRYLLVTNRCLCASEMLRRFKGQDKVEKRNQTIKGPIQIRPMFLHNENRIESLIFICMVALLVFSLLERRARLSGVTLTGRRLIEQFASLSTVVTFFSDGSCLRLVVPLTPIQQQVVEMLDLPPPDIYLNLIPIQ